MDVDIELNPTSKLQIAEKKIRFASLFFPREFSQLILISESAATGGG
jgi:hypothetical protein